MGGANMRNRVVGVVFLGFLLAGVATAWARGGRMVDVNGDGFKEAEVIYAGNQISRMLVDYNHDGYPETVVYYKNGYRERAEQDADRDGMTNRWTYYYFTGVPWKVEEDFDRDAKADYWFYLKGGE